MVGTLAFVQGPAGSQGPLADPDTPKLRVTVVAALIVLLGAHASMAALRLASGPSSRGTASVTGPWSHGAALAALAGTLALVAADRRLGYMAAAALGGLLSVLGMVGLVSLSAAMAAQAAPVPELLAAGMDIVAGLALGLAASFALGNGPAQDVGAYGGPSARSDHPLGHCDARWCPANRAPA